MFILGEAGFTSLLVRCSGDSGAIAQVFPTLLGLITAIEERWPDVLVLQAQRPAVEAISQLSQQRPLPAYVLWIDTQVIKTGGAVAMLGEHWQRTAAALEQGVDAYMAAPQPGHEVQLEAALRGYVQLGLGRAQLSRRLHQSNNLLSAIALSDSLTQMGNRRALDWELPQRIRAARRQAAPLSLLMLDVDRFKAVNDTYGHIVGDRVLQTVAERMRHNMRRHESPFRYGGEEFVVILSQTSLEEATGIAQRLCRLIGSHGVVIEGLAPLTVTVSIGVAALTDKDDAQGIGLIQRADAHMLQAKAKGRNQVIAG